MQLYMSQSLHLFEALYAVDAMRAGLAASVAAGSPRWLALWRRGDGVAVRVLRAPAAALVASLLLQEPLDCAMQAATVAAAGDDERAIAGIIATDVFQSGFVRLTQGDVHEQH